MWKTFRAALTHPTELPPFALILIRVDSRAYFAAELARGLRVEPVEPHGGFVRFDKRFLIGTVTEGCARRASLTLR
jgi:hypothetical protein